MSSRSICRRNWQMRSHFGWFKPCKSRYVLVKSDRLQDHPRTIPSNAWATLRCFGSERQENWSARPVWFSLQSMLGSSNFPLAKSRTATSLQISRAAGRLRIGNNHHPVLICSLPQPWQTQTTHIPLGHPWHRWCHRPRWSGEGQALS